MLNEILLDRGLIVILIAAVLELGGACFDHSVELILFHLIEGDALMLPCKVTLVSLSRRDVV